MKKAVLALVLIGAIAAYFAFDLGQYLSLENFKASQAEIVAAKDANPALYIAGFFLLYVAVTGLSIPGAAIMSLVAGALFGVVLGTIIVSFASTMGATLAFLSSRYLLRDWVQGKFGERCMALPVVVPVGEDTAERLRAKLIPAIEALRIGISSDDDAHYGPVVTAQHKAKVEGWIQTAVDEGSELVIDGRGFTLQGHEEGYFIGPTLLDHVTTEMTSYKEEIFGPVLQMVRAANFEEALALPSNHQYGNGVAIFTRNGHAAREFASRVNVGMVGINVPIPVPVAYHSFGGWKRSGFGDTDQYGMEGIKFWTKVKTVTARWPDSELEHADSSFVIPTMG